MHAGLQAHMLKCLCVSVDMFDAELKHAIWNIARFLGQSDTGEADLLMLHQHALDA
jgi:hypothetical protein